MKKLATYLTLLVFGLGIAATSNSCAKNEVPIKAQSCCSSVIITIDRN